MIPLANWLTLVAVGLKTLGYVYKGHLRGPHTTRDPRLPAVSTIGLHHGISIRWDAWKDEAQLQDGQALLNWLADRGVAAPLQAYRAAQHRAIERQETA